MPVTCSDHSAVTLTLCLGNSRFGPSFWKFNCSLLDDTNYIRQIHELIDKWSLEYAAIDNNSLFWDILKYHIRSFTIKYSKEKAKQRKAHLQNLEQTFAELNKLYSSDPNPLNLEKLNQISAQLDQYYDYITQGAIVRSRAQWVEKGEKSTKFFLGIEKRNRTMSHIQRVIDSDGNVIQDFNGVLSELKSFYSNLYKSGQSDINDTSENFITEDIPQLSIDEQLLCEGPITMNEAYEALRGRSEWKNSR